MPRKKAKERLYGYTIFFPSGETINNDLEMGEGPYTSEEDAEDAALEAISNWHLGAEIFHMSNPGDNPDPDDEDEPDYEIFEYDEDDFE